MAQIFDIKTFEESLRTALIEGMKKAAEPILRQALVDIEQGMRQKLASMLAGFIESSYDLERDGRILMIRVRLGKESL